MTALSSVGERLKSTREAKGISLEEASRASKVQRSTLLAIEENRVQEVLDPAYARIFVRKYAAFLGLDGGAVLQEYFGGRQASSEPPLTVQTELTRAASFAPRRSHAPTLAVIGAAAAAVIGIFFLGQMTLDLLRGRGRARSSAAQPASASAPRRVAALPPAPASRREELLVPLSKKLKLTLQATSDVWVQVKSDGAVVFQNVIPKEATESWAASQELELWTGNAGAMKLTLNGKPLEGLGGGVKRGVRITHAGIKR